MHWCICLCIFDLYGLIRGREVTLSEINSKEERQNKAFKKWISDNNQFFNLPFSQQQMLCDYVEGLNREIADLESDKHRGSW